MNDYTREKIKLRMLKRIALLWDISDVEHIDPVVKLLIEALAEEIFRLSGELSELDDRLLSKLAASMTPVSRLTARPAHGILSATPTESAVTIEKETVFEYRETKTLRKYNLTNIRFTPIVPFELINARIRWIQIQDKLFEYGEDCRKSFLASVQNRNEEQNNTIWVGIDISPEITYLENLSFYFDLPGVKDKYLYLRLLPYTRWIISDKVIEFKPGLLSEQEETTKKNEHNKKQTDVVLSDLKAIYDKHYITLRKIATDVRKNYPEEWIKYYPAEVLSQFYVPLIWIKVQFPPALPSEILEQLQVGINLLPVSNLSLRSTSQKMADVSIFLPLDIDKNEYFVEIDSVKDSSGRNYELLSSDNYVDKNKTTGTYSLRRGGVEQFSHTNDARSAILRLADIIRDRTLLPNTKTQTEFEQMINTILYLTNKITNVMESQTNPIEVKAYILVDRPTSGETLMVDYRITNGGAINNFKPIGNLIVTESYLSALEENIHFLTPVQGGACAPSVDKIKDMHRYMLTTHDKLFTQYDIINFCQAEYGCYINKIEIKPGVAISKKPKQGLIKTTDLYITMKAAQSSEFSIEDFETELLCKLEKRSPESFNYRIFITN